MRSLILDTDLGMGQPGSDIDDGFALALAVAEPSVSLELVTTVTGNTDVDNATRLTCDLLARLSTDAQVVRGAATPLTRPAPRAATNAERFHPPGADPTGRRSCHAAVALAEAVMNAPGQITLVAIGPLTNIALALILEPRVADNVRELVVMGGVYLEQTNVAGMPGEFNFWVDPEAASVVLGSGIRPRLVGLDVTRRVRLTRADADRMSRSGGSFAAFAGACTTSWIDHLEQTNPGDPWDQGSCALHDPLAVAVVTHPELVTWRPASVGIETAGERTRGVAIADLLAARQPPEANCEIAVDVDADAFREYFIGRMSSLP